MFAAHIACVGIVIVLFFSPCTSLPLMIPSHKVMKDAARCFSSVVFWNVFVRAYFVQVQSIFSSTCNIFVGCVITQILFVTDERLIVVLRETFSLCSSLCSKLCFWYQSYSLDWGCIVQSFDVNCDIVAMHPDFWVKGLLSQFQVS